MRLCIIACSIGQYNAMGYELVRVTGAWVVGVGSSAFWRELAYVPVELIPSTHGWASPQLLGTNLPANYQLGRSQTHFFLIHHLSIRPMVEIPDS